MYSINLIYKVQTKFVSNCFNAEKCNQNSRLIKRVNECAGPAGSRNTTRCAGSEGAQDPRWPV